MKHILTIILILLFSFTLNSQNIYDLSQYGVKPNTKENISAKLNKAIVKICENIKRENLNSKDKLETYIIKFKKGRYDFYEKGSFEREYYISNHDQVNPKRVGIVLENLKNVVLDGQGSEFVFHGRMLPISLIQSENCTLKNFSIDFENPHIAQVKIIGNTEKGIIFQPEPWVKYRITKDSLFQHYGLGWEMTTSFGIAFEEDTKRLVYNTSDILFNTKGVYKVSNNRLLAPNWHDDRLIPGTVVAMRTGDRPAPGIFMSHDKNTILESITVHYAEGMGLLAQLSENITLEKFNVSLKGSNDARYFTTQADATHFSGCYGKVISCNGLYEGMMDDAINVHGTYLKVVKRINDSTLVGRYMHYQSWGFEWGRVADTVQFIRSKTMEITGEKNIITSIKPYKTNKTEGAKEFIITFKDKLCNQITENEGFGIENLTLTPSVLFANNTVRNNRARGALFSTPKETIVENNLFDHTSGTAILLCGDCNGWYETGACKKVIIRNNRFVNALTSMFQFTNAVISIYPEIPDLQNQTKFFHGGEDESIIIENNTFETFDAPILYAKSVSGLLYRGNIIKKNNNYKPFHFNKNRFLFERVNNVKIEE